MFTAVLCSVYSLYCVLFTAWLCSVYNLAMFCLQPGCVLFTAMLWSVYSLAVFCLQPGYVLFTAMLWSVYSLAMFCLQSGYVLFTAWLCSVYSASLGPLLVLLGIPRSGETPGGQCGDRGKSHLLTWCLHTIYLIKNCDLCLILISVLPLYTYTFNGFSSVTWP